MSSTRLIFNCLRLTMMYAMPEFIAFLVAAIILYRGEPPPLTRPIRKMTQKYDFIVVGAGSAGCALAHRLSERGLWTVLLVEAGDEEDTAADVPILTRYLWKTKFDWNYTTVKQENVCLSSENGECSYTRGRALGGCTVVNAMQYGRGNKRDYNQWEAHGNPGWGYNDVLPYFKKSEDQRNPVFAQTAYHSTGGMLPVQEVPYQTQLAQAFLEAGSELGYLIRDYNGEHQTGFHRAQAITKDGARYSTGRAFISTAINRTNLDVAINTIATKILIDPVTLKAHSVELMRDGKVLTVVARKEIILCAGFINSPQLLLLSGIGPREDLEKLGIPVLRNLQVGRNLQDHCALTVYYKINQSISLTEIFYERNDSVQAYVKYGKGPLTVPNKLEVQGYLRTDLAPQSDETIPDVQFLLYGGFRNAEPPGHYWTVATYLLYPKSKGYIKLNSTDPFDMPLINPNYLNDPHDIAVLTKGARLAFDFGQTKAMQKYNSELIADPDHRCSHEPIASDSYVHCLMRQYSTPGLHGAGTCKMGPASNPLAVVDHKLKVHGVKRLRVADASIMPHVTSGNTNAPTIMIAEKAADIIKADWGWKFSPCRKGRKWSPKLCYT